MNSFGGVIDGRRGKTIESLLRSKERKRLKRSLALFSQTFHQFPGRSLRSLKRRTRRRVLFEELSLQLFQRLLGCLWRIQLLLWIRSLQLLNLSLELLMLRFLKKKLISCSLSEKEVRRNLWTIAKKTCLITG